MSKNLLIVLTLLIGAALPIQAALNGRLMRAFGQPVIGALISFATGTLLLFLYALYTRVSFHPGSASQTSWFHWLGGLIGAVYVTGIIMLIPRIGAGLAFSLAVSGQLMMSLLMDQYGMLGVPVNPITPTKLLGLAMLVGGVFLIKGK